MMGRDSIPRLTEPGVRGITGMIGKSGAMGFPPKKTTGKAVSKKSKTGVKKAAGGKKPAGKTGPRGFGNPTGPSMLDRMSGGFGGPGAGY